MSKQPDILLISSPPVFPFIPEAGGPYIASYLKTRNYEVKMLDLGIQCLHRLINEIDAKNRNPLFKLKKAFFNLKKEYHDFNQYERATWYFEACRAYYSRFYPPLGLGFLGIPVSDIKENERDINRHPFLKYAKEILEEKGIPGYGIFMFSVNHPKQFPVTLELAKFIKSKHNEAVIILGGTYISVILDSIEKGMFVNYFTAAFDWVDYMIPKLGEISIKSLLDKITHQSNMELSGYFIYREYGQIKVLNHYVEPALDELPGPDFTGIDFSLYFTPQPVFPLRTTSRCYWGKCRFCRGTRDTFAERLTFRTAAKVYEDMAYLSSKHHSPYFCFCEDATSPAMMTKLARILIEKGENFYWGSIGVRFDDCISEADIRLWAQAGCKHLSFGLETGSQSLINKMDKGIQLKKAEQILKWCTNNGIFTFCYVIFGHPDETHEEFVESLEFLNRNSPYVFTYSVNQYFLSPYQNDFQKYSKDEEIKKFFDTMVQYCEEIRYFGATKSFPEAELNHDIRKKWKIIMKKNGRTTKIPSYCGYNLLLPRSFVESGLKKDRKTI